MKILVLTPQLPYPPHQGTTLRNYNLLKRLAQRHSIDLFSLLAPGDDPDASALQEIIRHLTSSPQPRRSQYQRLRGLLLSLLPDMALRLWSPGAFDRLQEHIRRHPPDAIQVEGIEMAPYWLTLRANAASLPPVVYDAHNAEALLQRRAFLADVRRPRRWIAAIYSAVQTLKLQRYERHIVQAAAGIAAVSQGDAAALQRLAAPHSPPIEVVSNGVDLTVYDPQTVHPNPYPAPGPHLVFTGKMDFRPNVDGVLWFADRVLPQLLADFPQLHFWIVGKNPHARLDRLATHPHITITGAVPDIQPYIAHADVYVAPLLAGGGTRLKILEALAMAKPVVSTHLGADGIDVSDGEHLALADSPAAFAQRCRDLLRQRHVASAMGRRGRVLVEMRYNWDRIVPRMEELYAQLGPSSHISD